MKQIQILGEKGDKLTRTPEFFQCIRDFKVNSLQSGEWAQLTNEQHRFVNKLLEGLEHSGLNLPQKEQDELEDLNNELSKIEDQAK